LWHEVSYRDLVTSGKTNYLAINFANWLTDWNAWLRKYGGDDGMLRPTALLMGVEALPEQPLDKHDMQ
jgi:hypothetical protein